MAEFTIDDQKLEALKGKVVIVTGMQPSPLTDQWDGS
jgi:hypothetical protein